MVTQEVLDEVYTVDVEIQSISETDKYQNIIARILQTNSGESDLLSGQKILLKNKKSEGIIKVQGGVGIRWSSSLRLVAIQNRVSGFDYNDYLRKKDINYLSYGEIKDIQIIDNYQRSRLSYFRFDIRNKIIQLFQSRLSEKGAALAAALITGSKDMIDEGTNDYFVNSGSIHVLAVSGLHVGIIALLVLFIKKRLFPNWKMYSVKSGLLLFLALFLFAEISGGAPPVKRAIVMALIYYLGRLTSRKSHPLNMLAVSALYFMIVNPMIIYSVSFQLSYLAVLGIVLGHPILKSLFYREHKVVKYFIDLFYVGISALLVTAPISLFYFGQISFSAPINGMLIVPIAFVLTTCCLLFAFLNSVPVISVVLYWLIDFASNAMIETAKLFSKLEFLLLQNVVLSYSEVCLLSMGIIALMLFVHMGSIQGIKLSLFLLLVQAGLHLFYGTKHLRCVIPLVEKENLQGVIVGTQYFNFERERKMTFEVRRQLKEHRVNEVIGLYND